MAFEDKTLRCVTCESEFVFSAGEQDFYQQKNFDTPPKRCPTCRKASRSRKRAHQNVYNGEYRSPAFEDSAFRPRRTFRGNDNDAPRHRSARRTHDKSSRFDSEYRSPAFREYEAMDNADDYRSPAFKEYEHLNAQDEYRSPAFREYDAVKPEAEYRSPAFRNEQKKHRNERPLFEITCVACGEKAMVPFLAEEKDDPMCRNCYKEHKQMLREEADGNE